MPTDLIDRLRTALAGQYVIERELGRGGMAEVYLADDRKHHRKVAIKVLRPELTSLFGADRFAREIRMAASLSHPHILPLHDSGEADGLLFYVMPYVRGESLRQKLDREGPLPVDEALAITREVASALEHAHGHGLIHRDIKPENILLHEGEAMVTDFGIALMTAQDTDIRLTGTGTALGTPAYMSPEQAAGEPTLDPRSDIYSLACVLFELLAGVPPFTGTTAQAITAKRFTEPAPPIRRFRPAVPVAVDQALARALARVPGERFASADLFAQALLTPAEAPVRPPSVAVLPFLNLSADQENEFFADGITEDVIAQLSKIRALKVISRTSVMPYKKREKSVREIAGILDVATVLEGSVRRAGSRVRIVAQLIDASADRHLWADTYDREMTDIFAIQSDVALHIATALEAELSPDERRRIRKKPTDDLQAYQLFLLGKHCLVRWTDEGVAQGLKHLEQAITRDPNYALAYANIAYAYLDIGLGVAGSLPAAQAFARARAAVDRALAIDAELAEAHAVLGHLHFSCDYDWTAAEIELKRAIELNPNSGFAYDFYGLMLAGLERYDEAIEMQRRAHEVDPLNHRLDIATTMLRAGRYEEGLATVSKVVALEPHFAMARGTLGWAYIFNGRADEGIAELELAVSLSPSTMCRAQLGEALAMVGRTDDARRILAELEAMSRERYVTPYHFAYVHTGLGEHDRAMDYLERAYNERSGAVFGIKGSFLFIPLRSHPRFQALLRKMNLA